MNNKRLSFQTAPGNEAMLFKLGELSENLRSCIASNLRADNIHQLSRETFILDAELLASYRKENKKAICELQSFAEDLIHRLKETWHVIDVLQIVGNTL